jgi:hypothetical protein
MLNILFGFFLFGILVVLSLRAFYRAFKNDESLSTNQAALLVALAIGTLMALSLGLLKEYNMQLITY